MRCDFARLVLDRGALEEVGVGRRPELHRIHEYNSATPRASPSRARPARMPPRRIRACRVRPNARSHKIIAEGEALAAFVKFTYRAGKIFQFGRNRDMKVQLSCGISAIGS